MTRANRAVVALVCAVGLGGCTDDILLTIADEQIESHPIAGRGGTFTSSPHTAIGSDGVAETGAAYRLRLRDDDGPTTIEITVTGPRGEPPRAPLPVGTYRATPHRFVGPRFSRTIELDIATPNGRHRMLTALSGHVEITQSSPVEMTGRLHLRKNGVVVDGPFRARRE
jgi:hypothetical protein